MDTKQEIAVENATVTGLEAPESVLSDAKQVIQGFTLAPFTACHTSADDRVHLKDSGRRTIGCTRLYLTQIAS